MRPFLATAGLWIGTVIGYMIEPETAGGELEELDNRDRAPKGALIFFYYGESLALEKRQEGRWHTGPSGTRKSEPTKMTAKIIDGVAVAKKVRNECRERVEQLVAQFGRSPGLAVIVVGSNPASQLYVRNKIRACANVGIKSFRFDFSSDVDQDEVIDRIEQLNDDPEIHGILVQLPLPASFDMARILRTISVDKDVDGFHLYNVGGLVVGGTVFPPCTPYGVLRLLQHEGIPLEGKNVVVVGASNIVGKPMALMLMQHDATVSICHAKTRDLAQFTILAEVLVVAAGYPNLIQPEMVRTGAVVIDVGINRLPDGKLVGDVNFQGVAAKASYITPVPGGVGPMTVSMLLVNTVNSCERWQRKTFVPSWQKVSPVQLG